MGAASDDRDVTIAKSAENEDLAQRLAAARAGTVDAMERLLAAAQTGEPSPQMPSGTGHLLVRCMGIECALPLSALREVLPIVPQAIYLPFSPEWMLGIFPLRNEMVGLVDPAPLLASRDVAHERLAAASFDLQRDTSPSPAPSGGHHTAGILPGNGNRSAMAVVVGSGERCLSWVVEAVGDIALAQDGELHSLAGYALQDVPIARRYISRVYVPRETGAQIVVLDAEAVLTDLLKALEDGKEGRHV